MGVCIQYVQFIILCRGVKKYEGFRGGICTLNSKLEGVFVRVLKRVNN